MNHQEKIASPHPLPFATRVPADVFLFQRTIKSLEQENASLKVRLAQSLTTLAHPTLTSCGHRLGPD
jgi:hypothetical protein